MQVILYEPVILLGYIPIGIQKNYIDMTKFNSEDNSGFKAIVGELHRWVKELGESGNLRAHRLAEPQRQHNTWCM